MGHNYLGSFFAACDTLLVPGGILVMQAITTPENRYEEYLRSTDFINTIIFPGEPLSLDDRLRPVVLETSGARYHPPRVSTGTSDAWRR